MWLKYTFTCDPEECDGLLEFTARDGFGFPNGQVTMKCPCGRMMNYISYEELEDSETFLCSRCNETLDKESEHCDHYLTVCNYCCGCGCSQI